VRARFAIAGQIMLGLEKIVVGANLRGVAGSAAIEIVRTEWVGEP
jgi:hypothetical protein